MMRKHIPGSLKPILRKLKPFAIKGYHSLLLIRGIFLKHALKRRRNLKLHLGCGKKYLQGYINIDGYIGAKADIYLDFKKVGKFFLPFSAHEILMIHSISYLNLWEARDFFRTVHGLLKEGGNLIMECPDISNCSRKLLEAGSSETFNPDYLEGVRGFYAFGLDNLAERRPYYPYAFGWSGWHLKQELEEAGFREVVLTEPKTHEKSWRDLRIEARK